jgi:uncharacterized membrane protein YgcG
MHHNALIPQNVMMMLLMMILLLLMLSRIRTEQPLISHDLTEIRTRAMTMLATPFNEEMHVSEAMNVFLQARSNITPYLYDDVTVCFEWVAQRGIQIAVLTDGNALLNQCELFNKYASFTLLASEVGAMKPSPVGFITCSQLASIPINRIMYIGDNYDKDIIGANNAGMHNAFLIRKEHIDGSSNSSSTRSSGSSSSSSSSSSGSSSSSSSSSSNDYGSSSVDSKDVQKEQSNPMSIYSAKPADKYKSMAVDLPRDGRDSNNEDEQRYHRANVILNSLHPEELNAKMLKYFMTR